MKFSTTLYLIGGTFLLTFTLCEFLIYYVVLAQCDWPDNVGVDPVRTMLLADTHLLGPFKGHWWDKLRREWQMHRAFQTAIQLFSPEAVFFLGDLFDEGQWVDRNGFHEYVLRFKRLFNTPENVKTFGLIGNHDVGFHYRLHPIVLERFQQAFNQSAIKLHTFRNVHFVTINSMVLENDGCHFCASALRQLKSLQSILDCSKDRTQCKDQDKSEPLQYSRPIILQHFPTYRSSDKNCIEGDIPILEKYRENWEVLSKESTHLLGETLNPRVIFSGHSHHYCKIQNQLNVEEYTLSSFSWRNKNNPSFILAHFTPDSYTVSLCYLPQETTVIILYGCGIFLEFLIILCYFSRRKKSKSE